ncbi:MAG: hypothetical protein J07HX64_01477 [halophilic archaeon J07HX64]|nr:MAG: hypothetical protein J07HX64_01477 [halophilic archaeon J07HX64]
MWTPAADSGRARTSGPSNSCSPRRATTLYSSVAVSPGASATAVRGDPATTASSGTPSVTRRSGNTRSPAFSRWSLTVTRSPGPTPSGSNDRVARRSGAAESPETSP